jgi:hypothetical protein
MIAAFHRGAIDEARRIKHEIPHIGMHEIPIHDELELELQLDKPPVLTAGSLH